MVLCRTGCRDMLLSKEAPDRTTSELLDWRSRAMRGNPFSFKPINWLIALDIWETEQRRPMTSNAERAQLEWCMANMARLENKYLYIIIPSSAITIPLILSFTPLLHRHLQYQPLILCDIPVNWRSFTSMSTLPSSNALADCCQATRNKSS